MTNPNEGAVPMVGPFTPRYCAEPRSGAHVVAMIGSAQHPRRLMRPSHPLHRALVISAWALAAATLAGFLGAHWWVFDLLANLRAQLALGLVGSAVALVLFRRWKLSVVMLVGAAINLALVLPQVAGSPDPVLVASEAPTLDVTFFNAKIRADQRAVATYLKQRDDDLIVLAATNRYWVRAMMASDLELEVISGAHLSPGLEILILARDPDARALVHRATYANRDVLVEVVTEFDGQPLHVIGTHPVSPMTPQRAQRRDLLLETLGLWADRRDAPLMVLGDLNATPWSAPFSAMLEDTGLIDSQQAHGIQPSWPAWAGPFGIPIDHVLHSDDLVTLERELGPSFGSDHRMVHARLARRPAT